ncbi:MAG: hypothetical protein AAFY33_21365, partial [Cyanobacteria bacterium J06643_4]
GSVTRKGLGQALMSFHWHHRGYTADRLGLLLQTTGFEVVSAFKYGTGWSRRMCLAVAGVKPDTKSDRS